MELVNPQNDDDDDAVAVLSVDDLKLTKLNTRKATKLRQKQKRAEIIEKTRNLDENNVGNDDDQNHQMMQFDHSNKLNQQQQNLDDPQPIKHHVKREISLRLQHQRLAAAKENELKPAKTTIFQKLQNLKSRIQNALDTKFQPQQQQDSKQAPVNKKLLDQQHHSASASTLHFRSSVYNTLKENKISKPAFKISKITYDDRHLYEKIESTTTKKQTSSTSLNKQFSSLQHIPATRKQTSKQ